MSEFKGTPGPWKTQFKRHAELQAGSHVHVLTDGENFNIGLLSSWVNDADTKAEAEANAKLIAAAPDMWKALERIARPHDCGCVPCTGSCTSEIALQITVDEMRELARSAIAKAIA